MRPQLNSGTLGGRRTPRDLHEAFTCAFGRTGNIEAVFAWSLIAVFCGSTLAAIAGRFFNRSGTSRRSSWARSLRFSTAAVVPAILLLVECGVRLVHRWIVPGADVHPYDFVGVVPSLLWILIGPLLLAKAVVLRAPAMPRHVTVLQLTQAVSWASSSLVALWFAAMV